MMNALAETFRSYLQKAAAGDTLTPEEAASAFNLMMDGAVSVAQMAGFLAALAARGETADEILGAARALQVQADAGTWAALALGLQAVAASLLIPLLARVF
jgi:anthranilate phosphoribosyltransferase